MKIGGLLDGNRLGGVLDDAELAAVPVRVGAEAADGLLGQRPATLALSDFFHRFEQGLAEPAASLAVTLEQVKGHALCGLLPDTGKTAKRFDECFQQRISHAGIPRNRKP